MPGNKSRPLVPLIPCVEILDRDALGTCLGKEYRAVAALLDKGFAAKLQRILEEKI